MERTDRQEKVLQAMQEADGPLSGTELAERFGVTRQVVVHDIALLRAAGERIQSTARGYELEPMDTGNTTVLSVYHPPELTEIELQTLVDYGIRVLDVVVEHPVYGELRGELHLSSRRDVELFLEQVRTTDALLLSSLTDGFHLHTIVAPSRQRLDEAVQALRQHGIQVTDSLS